jgi:hypothetical protein
VLELIASAAPPGESGGVDHAVVGQDRCGVSVQVRGLAEGVGHDRCGDAPVGAGVQDVSRVVVEPGDDLDVGAGVPVQSGEAVVREVGLPGLVGLGGGEADVGASRALLRLGLDGTLTRQDPVDRRPRDRRVVVMGQVPADGLGASVQALLAQVLAQRQDLFHDGRWRGAREGAGAAGTGLERCLALAAVAGHEPADPPLGDAVRAGGLGLRHAGQDGRDDQTTCRHDAAWPREPASAASPCRCPETPHSDVLRLDTVTPTRRKAL